LEFWFLHLNTGQQYVFNLWSTMFCCFAVGKLLPSNNNRKGSLYRKLKLRQTPYKDKYEVSLSLHATHDDGHKLNATSYIQTKSVRTRASRLLLTLTRIIMLRSKYTQKYHSTSSSRNSFFGDEQFFKTLVFWKRKRNPSLIYCYSRVSTLWLQEAYLQN